MAELGDNFRSQYGPWALVCGASDGIGEAFAERLAAEGLNLVLLARREAKLEALAARIEQRHPVQTRVLVADLTAEDLVAKVRDATHNLEVGLLVYVSGSPTEHIDFLDGSLPFWTQQLQLNCHGPVQLAHHFGKGMRTRERGGMMFLSSLAAQSGGGRNSLYCGTKAFDQMFAESLWHELSPHGVDVLCLLLGATHSPTTDQLLNLDFGALFPDPSWIASAEDVAREGIENLANGPTWVASEKLRAVMPHLANTARAAAVEGGSAATAKLDRVSDYEPVWDAATGRKLKR